MRSLLEEIDKLQAEINAKRPFDIETLRQIREYYRIGLTYSSNALEGNSLTESETKIVLEEGITIGGKPLKHHFEATGHSDAFDFMYQLTGEKSISLAHIQKMHRLFYDRIDRNNAGKFRKVKAIITGSKYPPPLPKDIKFLMSRFKISLMENRAKKHPVEAAAIAHKDFVFIHPFIDGNGRVARLIMSLILLREGYNIAIIPPVMRPQYITALEKAHEDDRDFIELICTAVKETQKDYLRLFI